MRSNKASKAVTTTNVAVGFVTQSKLQLKTFKQNVKMFLACKRSLQPAFISRRSLTKAFLLQTS